MNEIEIVKLHVDTVVSSMQSNILRYYDALYELRRVTLFLMEQTPRDERAIEQWFEDEQFGVCPDGFWQSLPTLEKHRAGSLAQDAISFSCHPDLRSDPKARFRMYAHRTVGRYLGDIRSRLPGVAWFYYQDACNIALQYPYIDQATAITPDFDWSTYHTWISVSPQNNPRREVRWTAPSIDYAGEGLIISVSLPIYQDDEFIGLWSIDLPLKILYQEYIHEKHIPEQQNFVTDYEGAIVVHPITEAVIDQKKGSISREKIGTLGKELEKIDWPDLISSRKGHMEVHLEKHRLYDVFYKTIPEINWVYFSMFPKDRMIDVINSKVKQALDKVRTGDYSYRLRNIPEHGGNNVLVKSFNEMAEAIEAQHQQILESQRRIAQSEKLSAIGNLAGGIAHDFNNILSSIIGFTELALEEDKADCACTEYLRQVLAAGVRAKELVSRILMFARHNEEEMRPIRLDSIVKEVLKFLRSTIPSSIEICSNITSQASVLGDPISAHQILMNLCTNAAQAMEDGGALSITLEDVVVSPDDILICRDLPAGPYVKLTVEDNGTGIPEGVMASIFEPYFTTKPIGKGTGMGLSVVHGIVKKCKGEITVESEVGSGTRFCVYLPTAEEEDDLDFFITEDLPTGAERILFVDDELAIASVSGEILSGLGYRVTSQTSSLKALELFSTRKDDFDLVITDMTMPIMNGKELAHELLKVRPDIPVILCTGYSNKISDESARETGIKQLVYKPILKSELAKTVRSVLDGANGAHQP